MINETAVSIVRSSCKLNIQKIMINDIAVGPRKSIFKITSKENNNFITRCTNYWTK